MYMDCEVFRVQGYNLHHTWVAVYIHIFYRMTVGVFSLARHSFIFCAFSALDVFV